MAQSEKIPKVSVCVITYNQEKYIRQCLQSILDQETDFHFEVIVGDDCSTDNTRTIVQEFAQLYPETVRALLHARNVGGAMNYYMTHKEARRDYIANMDGDDAMLPGKLQKQFDFLQGHPSCAFVAHKMVILSEDGNEILGILPPNNHPGVSNIERLVESYLFFAHSSKMYRRSADVLSGEDEADINKIDFTMHIEHASTGDIGFINEVLGEYRKGAVGSFTSFRGAKLHGQFRATLVGYDRALELGVNGIVVSRGKSRYLLGAAMHCVQINDYLGMSQYLKECTHCAVKNSALTQVACLLVDYPTIAKVFLLGGLILRNAKHKLQNRFSSTVKYLLSR